MNVSAHRFLYALSLSKALCQTYTGISTCIAEEVCFRSGIDSNKPANCLSDEESRLIYNAFDGIISDVKNKTYSPNIVYDNGNPSDFAAVQLTMYDNSTPYDSISRCLIAYYHEKEVRTRIHQKSTDIRRIVTTHLERSYKKLDIQEKQLKDTENVTSTAYMASLLILMAMELKPVPSSLMRSTTILMRR